MRIRITIFFLVISQYAFSQHLEKPQDSFLNLSFGFSEPEEVLVYEASGLVLSIGYQKKFRKKWAFEPFFTYTWSNSFPDFFDDPQALDDFLMSQRYWDIYSNSRWEKYNYASSGVKLHFSPIGTKRLHTSLYLGTGFSFLSSSHHSITSWTYDNNKGQVSNYSSKVTKTRGVSIFYMPGISASYTFDSKYTLGLNMFVHSPIFNETIRFSYLGGLYASTMLTVGIKL